MQNKKAILTLVAFFGILAVFAATVAYSSNRTIFNNDFKLGEAKTIFTEEFNSPSNWMSCDTIDKTITIKNESNVDVAVRVKLEESWVDKDGNPLSLYMNNSDARAAIINFTNTDKWEQEGNYYYYSTVLGANQTAVTPISSVTFNCDANLGADEEYSDATYTLRISAQSIQADRKSAWHGNPLYDAIAAQTKGVDKALGVNYSLAAGDVNGGYGVFTFYKTAFSPKPVYYYRGQISNNFVVWNGYCWSIVRTTENGGVKLIYDNPVSSDGTCLETAHTINGSVPFNNSVASYGMAQFGYMYEGTTDVTKNTYDSAIKTVIDDWFKNNILDGEDELDDAVFCNDRKIVKNDYYTESYLRLTMNPSDPDYYYYSHQDYDVRLDCDNLQDKFTRDKENGNGDLSFPIALITADEGTLAGNCSSTCNSSASTLPYSNKSLSYLLSLIHI